MEKDLKELLENVRHALMNATGAYEVIKTLGHGVENLLPGLPRCEQKCSDTLKDVDIYLKNH